MGRRYSSKRKKPCLVCKHIRPLMMIIVAIMMVLLMFSSKLLKKNTLGNTGKKAELSDLPAEVAKRKHYARFISLRTGPRTGLRIGLGT